MTARGRWGWTPGSCSTRSGGASPPSSPSRALTRKPWGAPSSGSAGPQDRRGRVRRARHARLRRVPAADPLVRVSVWLAPARRSGGDPAVGRRLVRKIERRVVFTTRVRHEGGVRRADRLRVRRHPGASDLQIHTVVVGLEPGDGGPRAQDADRARARRRPHPDPYAALPGLHRSARPSARRGREFAEIAGNHRILVTVLAPPDLLPPVPGATELFEAPIQSRPDRRRLGLDVSVESLAAAIRVLEAAGRLHRAHL